MYKALLRLVAIPIAIASLSIAAHADQVVNVGFVSYDVTGTNVAEFDIANFTGVNSSTFPVVGQSEIEALAVCARNVHT